MHCLDKFYAEQKSGYNFIPVYLYSYKNRGLVLLASPFAGGSAYRNALIPLINFSTPASTFERGQPTLRRRKPLPSSP